MKRNAIIAMSGGVDSSVAAYLVKEQGFGCVGVTMKLFSGEDAAHVDSCCSRDAGDAGSVACRLGIPHHVFDFAGDFDKQVIRRFVEAYESGHTPNPCVDCNRYIKFGKLIPQAGLPECDFVATGHYARIERERSGKFLLKKALDEAKDQSYFLYSMTQEQLARTLFPLGGMKKKDVRKIAMARGFLNAAKRESQDVCFITCGSYADFIERYRGKSCEPGDFVDPEGNVLGRHKGAIRYTLGQRRGLGISFRHRLYVCGKNMANNTVTLGNEELLYSKTLFAEKLNWISGTVPDRIRAEAKIGYRRAAFRVTAERVGDDRMRVEFDAPQKSAAAGQAVVLYDGFDVLGGGTISV